MIVSVLLALHSTNHEFPGGSVKDATEWLSSTFGLKVSCVGFTPVPAFSLREPEPEDLADETLASFVGKQLGRAGAVCLPNKDGQILTFRFGPVLPDYPASFGRFTSYRQLFDQQLPGRFIRMMEPTAAECFVLKPDSAGYVETGDLMRMGAIPKSETAIAHRFHIFLSSNDWSNDEIKDSIESLLPLSIEQGESTDVNITRLRDWIIDSFPMLEFEHMSGGWRKEYLEARTGLAKEFFKSVDDETFLRFLRENDGTQYLVRTFAVNDSASKHAREMMRIKFTVGSANRLTESDIAEERSLFLSVYRGLDTERGVRIILTPSLGVFAQHPVLGEQRYSLGGMSGPLIEFK